MEKKINLDNYKSIVFLDSMVILEGKPLEDQRWSDIHSQGPILILMVPQVTREIDKRKKDGRIGKYARAFNRTMEPTALTGKPEPLIKTSPQVDICMASPDRINWDDFDDLDPEDSDAKVILQVLHCAESSDERAVFLSQDIYPISIASRIGVKVKKLHEHWLREPEPSPHQKEVQKLKNQVKILEASEPKLDICIKEKPNNTLDLQKVLELNTYEKASMKRRVLHMNPPELRSHSFISPAFNYDSTYNDRYETFKEWTVPKFISQLHKNLQKTYNQFPLCITISNVGNIQAENLILKIEIENGVLHQKWNLIAKAPTAPEPRDITLDRIRPMSSHMRGAMVNRVGRHEFDIDYSDKTISAQCEDFRHGTSENIKFILTPDVEEKPVLISIRVTASNLKGDIAKELEFTKKIQTVSVSDLFDFNEMSFKKPRPMEHIICRSSDLI